MNRAFGIFVAGLTILTGCHKQEHQDKSVFGSIKVINASQESIDLAKKLFPDEDKKILSEEGWKDLYAAQVARGENLDLGYIKSLGFQIDSAKVHNCKVYSFGEKNYDRIILYIHGGAYTFNAYSSHFSMCKDLATKDGRTKIVLPIYPLTPQHTWKDSYDLLDELYASLLKEGRPITIMGDSAGGGLACAFCEYLHKTGRALPSKRVLLSPWLDVTFSDPQARQIDPRDRLLCLFGLRKLGLIWKGDLDAKDYRISPLYGDLDDRIPTLIVVGTNEVMLPDCTALFNKLVANKCYTTLIYGIGLWHVFPTIGIPESLEVRQIIVDFIRK